MTRARIGLVAPGLVLFALLTGCASETEQYCAELEDRKGTLADLAIRSGEPDSEVLAETLDVWRELRDEAPGDVADEWSTLVFALEGLVEAFEAAGTNPGEYDPASPPPGVSEAEAKRLEDAAAKLASPRVASAGTDLQQHARDVCKVDLGLSTREG
ncbi:MAG TPA: hypothetical protein VK964_13715 [Nocardioidaceae bacterium]|nr:hypothetical protein [Nocardioidaceae bacterium]